MKGSGLFISKQIIEYDKKKEIKRKKDEKKRAKSRERVERVKRVESIIKNNPSGKPPPLPWEQISNFPDPNNVDLKKDSKYKKGSKSKTIKKVKSIKSNRLTIDKLKILKNKYNVSVYGNKTDIINGLWRVRGSVIKSEDLELMLPFLQKDYKKQAENLLHKRTDKPITNYKGMWKPLPKPLKKMKRNELIKHLQNFRDIWEKITTRNADLDDGRLNIESDEELRKLLEFYFSEDAKHIAEDYLR